MKIKRIIYPTIFLIISFAIFYLLPRMVKISAINCYSQFGTCSDKYQKDINLIEKKNYIYTRNSLNKVLSSDKAITQYSIRYKFPAALEIFLIEDKAKYAIKFINNEKIMNVSKSGILLSQVQNTSLPLLEVKSDLPGSGAKVRNEDLKALEILYTLAKLYKVHKAMNVDDNLDILLDNDLRIILPLTKDSKLMVGSVVLIKDEITKIEEENSKLRKSKIVDL